MAATIEGWPVVEFTAPRDYPNGPYSISAQYLYPCDDRGISQRDYLVTFMLDHPGHPLTDQQYSILFTYDLRQGALIVKGSTLPQNYQEWAGTIDRVLSEFAMCYNEIFYQQDIPYGFPNEATIRNLGWTYGPSMLRLFRAYGGNQ